MNEKNSDWNDLKFFLAVARNHGLSGAARETGVSAATLGRRMQTLEQATGIEIFERHARGYGLTEQGEALFARVSALDADVRPIFARDGDRQNRVRSEHQFKNFSLHVRLSAKHVGSRGSV